MKLSRLKLLLGATSTALLALLSAGPAYAGGYAITQTLTSNFQICDLTQYAISNGVSSTTGIASCGGFAGLTNAGAGGHKLSVSDLNSATFNDIGQTSSSLNGTAGAPGNSSAGVTISGGSVSGTSVTSDPKMSCIGSICGGISENDFNPHQTVPPNPTASFGYGDGEQYGSAIAGLPSSIPTYNQDATINTQAEGSLTNNGDAHGNTGLTTSTTNFSLNLNGVSPGLTAGAFTGPGAAACAGGCRLLALQFSASILQEAWLDPASVGTSIASSQSNFSFSIGGISFSPSGLGSVGAGNDTLSGLSPVLAFVDPFSLNQTLTATPGTLSVSSSSPGTLNYLLYAVVPTGVTLTGSFGQGSRADVTRVPEPGTIALLGIGLTGLGFAARRRKSARG